MFVKTGLLCSTILILTCGAVTWAEGISPDLDFKLRNLTSNEYHSCLVVLKEKADVDRLNLDLTRMKTGRTVRHRVILDSLQKKASQSQANLISYLKERRKENSIKGFRGFWITNAIQITAIKEQIEKIALLPEVERAYDDAPIELVEPIGCGGGSSSESSNSDNFNAIGIRKAWSMGFTGKG